MYLVSGLTAEYPSTNLHKNSDYRPNRLTLDRWSRDLNWVLDQNKHRALARGDMSIFHHASLLLRRKMRK